MPKSDETRCCWPCPVLLSEKHAYATKCNDSASSRDKTLSPINLMTAKTKSRVRYGPYLVYDVQSPIRDYGRTRHN
eukprot:5599723-Pleurochrysis_carterae.AAC.3